MNDDMGDLLLLAILGGIGFLMWRRFGAGMTTVPSQAAFSDRDPLRELQSLERGRLLLATADGLRRALRTNRQAPSMFEVPSEYVSGGGWYEGAYVPNLLDLQYEQGWGYGD